MDDFLVFCDSFNLCLTNLDRILRRCKETNLILNRKKCHFIIDKEIVLGHRISSKGIEVDRAKTLIIKKLPPPTSLKELEVF